MTSSASSTKPWSSGQTAMPSAPGRQAEHRGVIGDRHRRGGTVLAAADAAGEVAEPLGVARNHHPAGRIIRRLDMRGDLVEQVDALRPCARRAQSLRGDGRSVQVDGVGHVGRGVEGGELRGGMAVEQALPFRRFEIELPGGTGR